MRSRKRRPVRFAARILTLTASVFFALPAFAASNHTITQSGFSFSPNSLEIAAGDTVTWVWTGGAHTVTNGTSPADPTAGTIFCTNLGSTVVSSFCTNKATVFKHVFNAAGMFPFHCEPHYFLGMTGTINVTGVVVPPHAVHQVTVRDFEFDPPLVVADPGDTVRWVWESGDHTTTSGASSNVVHNPGALWNALIDQAHPTSDYVFTDAGLYPYFSIPDESLNMRGAVAVDSASTVGLPDLGVGSGLRADPPFPNPTALASTVMYHLDAPSPVRVRVFDITGRLVRSLVDESQAAGYHSTRWEGDSETGRAVGNGVFFVRIEAGSQSVVHKIFRNQALAEMGHHHH